MVFVSFESESVNCLVMSNSVRPSAVAHQAPLSMEFFRQEYWSGFPCTPAGDLSRPGIELRSSVSPALQADSLPTEPQVLFVTCWASQVVQWVKNLPAMQETQETQV